MCYSSMSMVKKTIKTLASLKLAVIIIIVLCVLIAAGTIVESQFNAVIASKLVYRTWLMFTAMSALVISLTAVMVDRWPWKAKHASFVLAHIGIIVLLFGSWLTMTYGLDGSLRVPINGSSHLVQVNQTDLSVYASFDGQNYTKLTEQEVDFYTHPPEQHPIEIPTDEGLIKIEKYLPFAFPERKIRAAENAGPAVRFQINNGRANFSEWLVLEPAQKQLTKDLGPAKVTLLEKTEPPTQATGNNEIFLQANPPDTHLKYTVFYKDVGRKPLRGQIEEGGKIPTGWMNLEFHLLRFLPSAVDTWEFKPQERPTELTTDAIEVSFNNKRQWLQLDDVLKFYSPKAVYVVTYGHRKIDLGFGLNLKKFDIGRHQGIMKAMSYQSVVTVDDKSLTNASTDLAAEHLIAMNEPLKYKGLTFYQASFQEDPETGMPIASVFSVNADPGRWFKYLGSLLIVLGTIFLFYNRRQAARKQAPATNVEVI